MLSTFQGQTSIQQQTQVPGLGDFKVNNVSTRADDSNLYIRYKGCY